MTGVNGGTTRTGAPSPVLRLSHVGMRDQEPRVVFLSMKLVAECCDRESRVGPVAQDNNNLSTMAWCIAPVW